MKREMTPPEDAAHLEEQAMEIEALESIYADDLQLLENESAHPRSWNSSQAPTPLTKPVYLITVYPQRDEDGGSAEPSAKDSEFGIELYFAHSTGYPETNPFVHVSSVRGLSVAQVTECAQVVSSAVEENAGMAMIFSLVTAVQDWVNGLNEAAAAEVRANDPKEQEQRRRVEEEDRILKLRQHGHEVTVDSFLAWREQFVAETAGRETAEAKIEAARLTGKAWFLQQQAPIIDEVAEYEDEAFLDSASEDGVSLTDDSDDDDDLLDELMDSVEARGGVP